MKIRELKGSLPDEVIESATSRKIEELTPPQELAIEKGLLLGKHVLVASPTASGKTLIGEMAMLKTSLWERKKAVYIAPMRALVTEKYNELKEAYPYMKIAMSIGDLDSLDQWLEKYDIILASTEKLDSLIRHGAPWLSSIGCIVIDEVHMLDDVSRGPTLEILTTKLARIAKGSQIVALSATIGNAEEIAEWLDSELVRSDYRPVPLQKGVELNGNVSYLGNKEEVLKGSSKLSEIRIAEDTLAKGKQILAFYATRRNAEAGAEHMSGMLHEKLSTEEKEKLKKLSKDILSALDKPTIQCERLARCVEKGVAFHHSGLVNRQRNLVEEAFRDGRLKIICATTTLGYGVNLPAHTVLVRDTSRYDGAFGRQKISVNEVLQLFGRAGRPRYDKTGRALLISKSEAEREMLHKRYIDAEPEAITSKLGVLPVLRTHILAFIASEFLTREDSILSFMKETFYGYQYSDEESIHRIITEILEELTVWDFIRLKSGKYEATKLGQKVSELYIDPVSAKWIVETLPKVDDVLSGLFMMTNTLEMRPYSKMTEEAEEGISSYYRLLQGFNAYESHDEPERAFSTALMLRDWISEKTEGELLVSYGETPGSLYTKISNADWLAYSSIELAKLLHINYTKLLELRARIRYGIKDELLDLIRLEQVGRVRARLMYNNGIKGIKDLRKEGMEKKIEGLLGKEVGRKVYAQVKDFAD